MDYRLNDDEPVVPQHVAKGEEFIICAAIWYDDGIERPHLPRNIKTGIVSSGWRHGNCITILATLFPAGDYKNGGTDKHTVQGFLTSEGYFVDRKEAGEIAYKVKQTTRKTDFLFSEDLY